MWPGRVALQQDRHLERAFAGLCTCTPLHLCDIWNRFSLQAVLPSLPHAAGPEGGRSLAALLICTQVAKALCRAPNTPFSRAQGWRTPIWSFATWAAQPAPHGLRHANLPLTQSSLASLTPCVPMQVAGNFHFAPGKSFQQGSMHVHDLVPFRGLEFDTSHIIDKLSFGLEYPGMTNPLDKTRVSKQNTRNPAGRAGAYQYFLKAGTCRPGASTLPQSGPSEALPLHPRLLRQPCRMPRLHAGLSVH